MASHQLVTSDPNKLYETCAHKDVPYRTPSLPIVPDILDMSAYRPSHLRRHVFSIGFSVLPHHCLSPHFDMSESGVGMCVHPVHSFAMMM